jgi:23S rRNA (cytosine1962-C5)-methyltransferase
MEDFTNRLRKVHKHIGKWAKRQGITCFRIYDCDIPEYPVAIDKYGEHLYIAVFYKSYLEKYGSLDEWVEQISQALHIVLDVPISNQHIRIRQRQKGIQQYEKIDDLSKRFVIEENGLKFWVNLDDYLDTGLFLDHRNTRQLVRLDSNEKKILNLFAYTGSFSVYAAAGGALSTTTVDLSNTYLRWAADNMALNGFDAISHNYIQADVMAWIKTEKDNTYDLVIMDPPTFSNSKRMDDILDIQRDHGFLISEVYRILNPNGRLYFSTNFRGFKLDAEAIPFKSIKEITHITIPEDFRNKKIHRCWLMEK